MDMSSREFKVLSLSASLLSLFVHDAVYRGCSGILSGNSLVCGGSLPTDEQLIIGLQPSVESLDQWQPLPARRSLFGCMGMSLATYFFQFIMFLVCAALLLIPFVVDPERHDPTYQPFRWFILRSSISWLALFSVYHLQHVRRLNARTSTSDLPRLTAPIFGGDGFSVVRAFRDAIRSPLGYVGLAAFISWISMITWKSIAAIFLGRWFSREPVLYFNCLWGSFVLMMLIGISNYVRHQTPVAYLAPLLAVRVITDSLSFVYLAALPSVHDHQQRNTLPQLKAFLATAFVSSVAPTVSYCVYKWSEHSIEHAYWATAHCWSEVSLVFAVLCEYITYDLILPIFRHRWWVIESQRKALATLALQAFRLLFFAIQFSITVVKLRRTSGFLLAVLLMSARWLFQLALVKMAVVVVRRRGATTSFTLSLPRPALNDPRLNDTCAICLLPLLPTGGGGNPIPTSQTVADIRRTRCGHLYHVDCLNEWLFVERTCPVCRAAV